MFKDRTVQTAILLIILIFIFKFLPIPKNQDGEYPDYFWAKKYLSAHEYDVVFAGDSRITLGISPKTAETVLGQKVLNFAFPGNYSDKYLKAVESKLDPHSSSRKIALGITPLSLTDSADDSSMFAMNDNMSEYERYYILKFHKLDQFFEPRTKDIVVFIRNNQTLLSYANKLYLSINSSASPLKQRPSWYQTYYQEGWIGGESIPPNPDMVYDYYQAVFPRKQVSDEKILSLLQYVKRWSNKGIEIYGFRPPVSKKIKTHENLNSGFNEDDFIKAFTEAGGKWIYVEDNKYKTADGSHIHKDEVSLFTDYVSNEMNINK